jgi:L-ascorbate metabolism protein UlaG (beta-lactamase superfamily)
MLTLTRIAHSTVLLDFDGERVLTDPWFSERWGYYHGEPYGIEMAKLPRLSAVIVSHGHYDHYDMKSFAAYPDKSVPMLVKRGIGEKARKAGFTDVREMDAWDSVTIGGVKITAAPAKHAPRIPEITFLLEGSGKTVYFGADTLLIPELREITTRFPRIDLALVPVNGLILRPMLNRQVVMNALEAAELCALIRPRIAVPIHYAFKGGRIMDTLVLKYSGTAEEFKMAAQVRAPETQVRILAPGEPLTIQ